MARARGVRLRYGRLHRMFDRHQLLGRQNPHPAAHLRRSTRSAGSASYGRAGFSRRFSFAFSNCSEVAVRPSDGLRLWPSMVCALGAVRLLGDHASARLPGCQSRSARPNILSCAFLLLDAFVAGSRVPWLHPRLLLWPAILGSRCYHGLRLRSRSFSNIAPLGAMGSGNRRGRRRRDLVIRRPSLSASLPATVLCLAHYASGKGPPLSSLNGLKICDFGAISLFLASFAK